MQESDDAKRARQKEAMRAKWSANAETLGAMVASEGGLFAEANDLMLAALARRPGMRVLDIASGAGDPALAIASTLAPAGGHVTATDLVPGMLQHGERTAADRGITNVTFQQADAEALPFPDASFEAVTCRFGVMLIPDVGKALAEMRRVLVQGGQLVCMVWGPPERDALARPMIVARQYLGLPESTVVPDAPHRFRLSTPGELAGLMEAVGFARIAENLHEIPARFAGGIDTVWETVQRMDGPIREAAARLPADRVAELERRVRAAKAAEDRRPGGSSSAVILVTGYR